MIFYIFVQALSANFPIDEICQYLGTSTVIARQISYICKSWENPESKGLYSLIYYYCQYNHYLHLKYNLRLFYFTFKTFGQVHFKPRFYSYFASKVVFRPASSKRVVGRSLFSHILWFIYKPRSIPVGPNRDHL